MEFACGTRLAGPLMVSSDVQSQARPGHPGRAVAAPREVLGKRCGISRESDAGFCRGLRRERIRWTRARAAQEHVKPEQPPLAEICRALQHCFFEISVQNLGRPAGKALHEFVSAAVEAYMAGYSRHKLALQLAYGDGGMDVFRMKTEGYRLTASEELYQAQWLDTIYVTLQMLKVVENEASRAPATDNPQLLSIVHRVLEGQRTGEEQSFVKIDQGLATKGASGGAIAEKQVIAPQWVPITQLVLLTLKVVEDAKSV